MSEEEKKAVFQLRDLQNDKEHLIIEQRQAITTILNLIETQQKEIEELKNEVMEKELIIDGMKEDRRIAVEEIQEQYYVSKDKIRAKIEEYEDYGTSIYYGLRSNGRAFHQAVRMEVKEVLQSLLKEE